MPPSKRDIENAWKVHDEMGDSSFERNCEKFAPAIKDDKGNQLKDEQGNELYAFNDKLGHSHYNSACQAWVMDYASKHPIPPKTIPIPPKQVVPKKPCDSCHKLVREDKLYQEELKGMFVCSEKCERRIAREMEIERAMLADESPPPPLPVPAPQAPPPSLPEWIINGVCKKPEAVICNLGYACDGCPYISPEVLAAMTPPEQKPGP